MKNFMLLLFTMISFVFFVHGQSDKFVLITSLYNEKEEARIAEYVVCMERNLAHAGIDAIHVLYDVSKDDDEGSIILDYLRAQKQVVIHYISGRPTYHQCFELASLNIS